MQRELNKTQLFCRTACWFNFAEVMQPDCFCSPSPYLWLLLTAIIALPAIRMLPLVLLTILN